MVDLDTGEVIDVEDHGVRPCRRSRATTASRSSARRAQLRALEITQPDGPGFTVDGWQVRWQKWSLRVGFCPARGS